ARFLDPGPHLVPLPQMGLARGVGGGGDEAVEHLPQRRHARLVDPLVERLSVSGDARLQHGGHRGSLRGTQGAGRVRLSAKGADRGNFTGRLSKWATSHLWLKKSRIATCVPHPQETDPRYPWDKNAIYQIYDLYKRVLT